MVSKSILSLITLSLAASSAAAIEIEMKFPEGVDKLKAIEEHHKFVEYLDGIGNLKTGKSRIPQTLMFLRNDFVEWKAKFDKVYDSIEEEFERMLIWVENHGKNI